MRRNFVVFAAVLLVPAVALADGMRAEAEMKGCTNASIKGKATLVEQVTPEGVKEVTVELRMTGLRSVCSGGRPP